LEVKKRMEEEFEKEFSFEKLRQVRAMGAKYV